MLSPIEVKEEPQTPPIVLAASEISLASVIKFDASRQNELRIPVQIRNENTTEVLKVRMRIVTSGRTSEKFLCPEPEVPPNNAQRRDFQIVIAAGKFTLGTCHRIDFIVSGDFQSCKKNSEWFDYTYGDPDEEVGRATFWVWEVSNEPLNPANSQALLSTCPALDRTTPQLMEM